MNIYFLPTSERGMGDEVLRYGLPRPYAGGMWNLPFLDGLSDALKALGHEVHTTDFWSREKSKPDDVLVVQNHPGETFLWRLFYYLRYFGKRGGFVLERRKFLYDNYRFFNRRVLIHVESPMITPYVYKHLADIRKSGIYQKIFLSSRKRNNDPDYFNLYDYRNQSILSDHFYDAKDNFLILLNANMRPHSLKNELYGERLKAIKYWSNVSGFDLYGFDWDKLPRHILYFHYKKYVDRAWRGRAGDKIEVLCRYKFAICYENASYAGYVSEKIYDCMAAGTIPIYLGAPDIETIVPADCFIDFRKFNGYPELHEYLRSLSQDDIEQYRKNILRFLNDHSTMKGMQSLAREVLGLS